MGDANEASSMETLAVPKEVPVCNTRHLSCQHDFSFDVVRLRIGRKRRKQTCNRLVLETPPVFTTSRLNAVATFALLLRRVRCSSGARRASLVKAVGSAKLRALGAQPPLLERPEVERRLSERDPSELSASAPAQILAAATATVQTHGARRYL